MKVLLDTCVWGGAKGEIAGAGYDTRWMGDLDRDPGDKEILALAHSEGRVLITLDKDFGELAVRRNEPHCGIIRLVNISARQQGSTSLNVMARFADELSCGAIVTVEAGRVRIRKPGD
jgi:predicted nuclease of predicted toxin-antitoxin system